MGNICISIGYHRNAYLGGLIYILYIIWNFKIPHNFWLKLHSYRSSWDWKQIADRNPIQTFIRRYNFIND